MTRPDTPAAAAGAEESMPVGTDADEQRDAGARAGRGGRGSTDDEDLRRRRAAPRGRDAGRRPPSPRREARWRTGSTTARPGSTSSATAG